MEDWGPRSPANPIPFPRRGRGLPPGGQQGAPRQHVNRQQVRSLAPFGTLSHAPLPQGPIRLAVGPRTCRPPPLLHPLGPLLRFHARHLEINDPACQAPGTLGPQYPLGSKLAHWLSPSTGLCDAAIFACLAVALAAGVGLLFASNFPGSHSPFVHFWVGPLIIPALHPNSPSAPVLSAGFRVEDFCPLPTPPDWTYAMETTSS